MNAAERHERLIQAVAEGGTLSIRRAVQLTGASAVTVRRDFTVLADKGTVERFHGGIGLPAGERMSPFTFRNVRFSAEKAAIAKAAARLLSPGDVVFVDGGTTTCHLAGSLPDIPIRIFTNSLRFAETLESQPHRRHTQDIHLTGGLLYPNSGLLVGPAAVEGLQQYHADWAFLSASGIAQEGLYNTNERVVEAERIMIRNADKVAVLADHSKIGKHAMCKICDCRDIDVLVTDADPKRSTLLPRLEEAGMQILLP